MEAWHKPNTGRQWDWHWAKEMIIPQEKKNSRNMSMHLPPVEGTRS
jgi:hypothetical protein